MKQGNKLDQRLQSFYFQKNSLELIEESNNYLMAVSDTLSTHKNLVILLVGHSDLYENSGCDTLLSFRRAQFIKEELVLRGITPQRLYTKGMGCAEPWFEFPDSSSSDRVINRRVRIELLRY